MPRVKSNPTKITKITTIRRGRKHRGWKRTSFRKKSRGLTGTRYNYSTQKMISVANVSAVQGSTNVNLVVPFMQPMPG